MTYIQVRWNHTLPDEPVMLYSELDDARFEVRKVELFANGESGHADRLRSKGKTRLGEEPIPPIDEIAGDQQFAPIEITKAAFETVWEQSRRSS